MFGALRSPLPAVNGNRASSTPQRLQCVGIVTSLCNAFLSLRTNIWCKYGDQVALLYKLQGESSPHNICCGCVSV
jgi:hypothetical protein